MITEEEKKARLLYIGGGDIAGILGKSRWRTALQVWAEKTGAVEPKDVSDKLQVRVGVKLEATIAEIFEEETGKKLARVNAAIVHPKYPFLQGHIDRRVVGENAVFEAKSTSAWRRSEWENEQAPAEAILQTMFYMALTGANVGYLAALIGNQDFKIVTIPRDEKVLNDIIKKAVHFWSEFVEKKVIPFVGKDDGGTLDQLFPTASETEIRLDDEAARTAETLEAMRQDFRTLEGSIEREQNRLKALLGEASVGIAGNYQITWRQQTALRLDSKRLQKEDRKTWEAFSKEITSRVFRVKKMEAQNGDE